jgi:hypothetical protein
MTNTTEPIATVRHYVASFNNGSVDGMTACFASPGSILDGMAPHLWIGPTAASDWYRDVLIEGEHHGATGYTLTLGDIQRNDITGDRAYIIMSAILKFELKGQPMQTPGLFTVVLKQSGGEWLINAWAWAKGIQL